MPSRSIHTTSDWMRALADAMTDRDELLLELLQDKTRHWLQTEDETEAQQALLEAAWTLIAETVE